MELEFLGAAGTVTGSKHLLRTDGGQWLVDCGLYQGLKELRERNWAPLGEEPSSISGVLVTHAHIDHIGYLPRFENQGFRGPIWSTRPTAKLASILLPDSGRLQEEEAEYHNRRGSSKHKPALPLYTGDDGERTAARFQGVRLGEPLAFAPGMSATFRPAGHILGAAEVRIDVGTGNGAKRILFSGDIGRWDAPILVDPTGIGEADIIVMESTYGNRVHDHEPPADLLAKLIQDTVARGGVMVIPAFAVGRTQEILYHLDVLERSGRIPRLVKYIDSPMAVRATQLYRESNDDYDEEMNALLKSGQSPFVGQDIRPASTVEESRAINQVKEPAIIISASGMATGGRVLHHLKNRLPNDRNTVLLVGYQAVGTRGRKLEEGASTIRIFGEDVPVRAHVECIHGFSAHADSDGLMRWLRTATRPPKQVFLVHGDPEAAQALAARIKSELAWAVTVPNVGDRVPLA